MAQTRSPVATTIVYNLTGQTDFTVPFEYLARKYVELTLLGITRQPLVMNSDYRFVSKTVVSLNVNPGAGFTQLEIRRNTSATERLVDFHDGSILRANDLNISQIQSLHVAEEARSNVSDAISIDDDGNLDARNRKIVNLLGGTADTDAVNYGQLRQFDNSTLVNAARAEQARFAAEAAAATAQAAGTGNVRQLLTKDVTLWKAGEVIDYPNARRLFNGQEYVGQIITDQPHTCAATFAEDSAFWTLSKLQPATAGYFRMSYWKWMLRNGNALNIACFGDSTMWGATIGNLGAQDPNNAPASLGKALSLLYGVNNNIVNRAISGTTLRQMLEGTDGSGAPFEYHVSQGSAQNAHIIYCNHGINDSQLLGDVGQYRKDLFEFVQTVRRWGKTPCLVTPNPNPSIVLINETKGKNLESFVS
ncbi:MAG: phage tail fiber protein, partial [Aeromonas sp.]